MNGYKEALLSLFSKNAEETVIFLTRLLLPVIALLILYRSAKSLLSYKSDKEVWGYLSLPNGGKIELNHWENSIGRSKLSDVVINYPTVSRTHAALIRDTAGEWMLYDAASKSGTKVNEKKISPAKRVKSGDIISMGGADLVFVKTTGAEERQRASERYIPGGVSTVFTLFLLTLFMALLALQLIISKGEGYAADIGFGFGVLTLMMWVCFIVTRALDRFGYEVETLAFFLSGIGLAVAAGSDPGNVYESTLFLLLGIVLFWLLGWFLRDIERVKKLRWWIAAMGLALLIVNLLTAESVFGAKNWISLGSISFQPSEFVKICFVFAGSATLDRLFARRNILLFVAFAGMCVGCIALMNDFGTASIFFVAYLVIAFMRSGSFAAVLLSGAGAAFAVTLVLAAKPYIADRFATWGKAWEFANEGGYQQVRTMSAAASGGLFGLGAGSGWLRSIFAADTDMVFGILCEELGLILAVACVAVFVIYALFAAVSSSNARSSYYAIAACAAVSIMMFQVILNVFGSLDILPFTGVTFPLVSNGGSSFVATWGLLAFVKAADTRQNASFAIKLPRPERRRKKKRGDEA